MKRQYKIRLSLILAMIGLLSLACSEDDPFIPAPDNEPAVKTGTIVIDPNPDSINAAWTLTDFNDETLIGVGDTTITDAAKGRYAVVRRQLQ